MIEMKVLEKEFVAEKEWIRYILVIGEKGAEF